MLRDGEMLFAVAEERLSRLQARRRFPVAQFAPVWISLACAPNDLDFLLWLAGRAAHVRHDLRMLREGIQPAAFCSGNSTRHFASMWHQRGGENRFSAFRAIEGAFRFIDHHLAHAISAYAFSGFDDAACWCWMGAAPGRPLLFGMGAMDLEHIWTIPWPNSLGLFYAQFTQYLGFQPYSDEWKVMGLAPYGEPGINLRDFIVPDDNPYRVSARL